MACCKKIKQVRIIPGCISCGSCEATCPEVFQVKDVAYVKENVDANKHADAVKEAAYICPVNVIMVDEENEESE